MPTPQNAPTSKTNLLVRTKSNGRTGNDDRQTATAAAAADGGGGRWLRRKMGGGLFVRYEEEVGVHMRVVFTHSHAASNKLCSLCVRSQEFNSRGITTWMETKKEEKHSSQ